MTRPIKLGTVLCALAMTPCSAQLLPSQAMGAAQAQVAMVSVGAACGAGIVVGYDEKKLYVATAAHVVDDLTSGASQGVAISLYGLAGEARSGALFPKMSPTANGDLAVIVVERDAGINQVMNGLDFALLSPDSAPPAQNSRVSSIGCSAGTRWKAGQNETLRASDNENLQVDSGVTNGQSGGGLFSEAWELIGMPYYKGSNGMFAHPIAGVIQQLKAWGVPVALTSRPPRNRARGAEQLSRESRAMTLATQAQRMLENPSSDGSLIAAYAISGLRIVGADQMAVTSELWNAAQRVAFVNRVKMFGPDPFAENPSLAFGSADARSAVTLDDKGVVSLWDDSGEHERLMLGPANAKVIALVPDGHSVAIARADRTIEIRTLQDGQVRWTAGVPAQIRSLTFSASGAWLVTDLDDNSIRVWKVGETQPRFSFLTGAAPHGIMVCDSGDTIGEFDDQGKLVTRTKKGGAEQLLAQITAGTDLAGFAFSPDCHQITLLERSGTARIVATVTGKEITRLPGSTQNADSAQLSPNSRLCLIVPHIGGEYDPVQVELVSLLDGRRVALPVVSGFDSAAFTADSSGVVIGQHQSSGGGSIALLDVYRVDVGGREDFVKYSNSAIAALAFDTAGSKLLMSSSGGDARVMTVASGQEVQMKVGVADVAALSPDGRTLALGHTPGAVRIFSATDGVELPHPALAGGVNDMTFTPEGKGLLFASREGGRLTGYDLASRRAESMKLENCCALAAFSPNARWLSYFDESAARVVDVTTGKVVRSFEWETYEPDFNEPTGILVTPDGTTAAVAQADGEVLLLKIPDTSNHDDDRSFRAPVAKEIETVPAIGARALAFSRTGARLAVAAPDGDIRVIQMRDAVEIARVSAGTNVTSVAISDSGLLAAGDDRGRVRLWNLSISAMTRRLCASPGSNLSDESWRRSALSVLPRAATCESWP